VSLEKKKILKKSFEKELENKALQVADLEKEVARLKVLLENRPLLEYLKGRNFFFFRESRSQPA